MSNFSLFDSNEIFEIFFDYVKNKYEFKDLGNRFIIRKVGRIKRLHYAIDDLVDWWDLDIKKDELEYMLKNEIYTKAVFKNILEFSNIKQVLDNLSIKPKKVSFSKVYYISFDELNNKEKILRSLSYNQRRNIKKYQNRLNKINYDFLKIDSFEEVFDKLLALIIRRHKYSFWNEKNYIDVMKKALVIFETKNMLDTFVMKNKNKLMSINVVIIYKNRAFWWITTFDEEFYYYSPSTMSLWYMINYYLERGFKEFNFMKGESEYKSTWTKNYYKLYRYEFENPSLIRKVFSIF